MRWGLVLGIALLAGMGGTGCPEQLYGKGGALDDAMREDIEEQYDERQREMGKKIECRGKERKLVWHCDDPKNRPDACYWKCE
jgi:hypothetical protein